MDFKLNEEQCMLRDMVDRFVQERFDPATRPHHRTPAVGHDRANWALLAELGLLALPFAEQDGGIAGGPIELMVVTEALGRGVSAEPYFAEILFAGQLLAHAGTAAQKERLLGGVISGKTHLAVAHAEPRARFALDHVEARFVDGRLTGSKSFVLAGAATDAFIVSARNAAGAIGLYLAEAGTAGVSRQDYRLIDGSTAAEIHFDGTLAEPMDGGIDTLLALVDALRVPIAAEMMGLMSTLFEVTLDYIKVRKQFGTSIGSFQAIQHRMADLYLAVEQSRSLLYRAALVDGARGEAARIGAKAYIAEAGIKVAEEAIQLHGGMGITDELIVGHAYKRMMLLGSLFGDPDTEIRRYAAMTR